MNRRPIDHSHPLPGMLEVAVPVWVHAFKQHSWAEIETMIKEASEFGKELAERGDVLLYGSKKGGEASAMFNKTSRAIALLSFLPGGVTLFGAHWENEHPKAGNKT